MRPQGGAAVDISEAARRKLRGHVSVRHLRRWKMIVLCATDLSVEADEAIRQADAYARSHQSKLIVFHALPNAMLSSPLFPQASEAAAEGFVAFERDVLRILSERVAVLTGR